MIRKLGATLLCATILFSTQVFSATEYMLNQSSMEYPVILPPNEPQLITNTFFWTIQLTCTIISDTEDNAFSMSILRKSGSLNGIPLTKGDTMDLIVHPGDQLYVTAASGGRVELLNRSENALKASCVLTK